MSPLHLIICKSFLLSRSDLKRIFVKDNIALRFDNIFDYNIVISLFDLRIYYLSYTYIREITLCGPFVDPFVKT